MCLSSSNIGLMEFCLCVGLKYATHANAFCVLCSEGEGSDTENETPPQPGVFHLSEVLGLGKPSEVKPIIV